MGPTKTSLSNSNARHFSFQFQERRVFKSGFAERSGQFPFCGPGQQGRPGEQSGKFQVHIPSSQKPFHCLSWVYPQVAIPNNKPTLQLASIHILDLS